MSKGSREATESAQRGFANGAAELLHHQKHFY